MSVLVGVSATALSGCCGSREGGDSAFALYGLIVDLASGAAGVLLWLGGASRLLVLGLAAAAPVACVVASPSSADLAAVAPFAVVGWLLLAWFVNRGRGAAWLTDARHRDEV
jgi:hypothetical protein